MRYKALPISVKALPRTERRQHRPTPRPHRLRDWLATIPIILLLPALIVVGDRSEAAGTPVLDAPAAAERAQAVRVTGSGFPKNRHLQLLWDGSAEGMPATKVTSRGQVDVLVVVPAAATVGPHTLSAAQAKGPGDRGSVAAATGTQASTAIQVLAPAATETTPTLPSSSTPAAAGASPLPSGSPTATPAPTANPAPTATPTVALANPTPAPGTPAPTVAPTPPPPPAPPANVAVGTGIWLTQAQLMALPTSGGAWDRLVAQARSAIPREDLSCQDARASHVTMATALVAARTNDNSLRAKVRDELMRIIGTENGSTCGHPDRNRPLGLGRNLAGYVIAADLIGFRSFDPAQEATWRVWLSGLRSTPLPGGWALNSSQARGDHSNWGAHQAAALTAADAYLGDAAALAVDAAWARAWVDVRAPKPWNFKTGTHDFSWSATGIPPTVPVNPAGAVKSGVAVDGIPLVDMQRGGGFTTGAPVLTHYPREALVGRTVQFEILHRMGYPSYGWGDGGLLRVAQRLLAFSRAYDAGWYEPRVNAYWILAARYGVALPRAESAIGRQVIGVDWTHRGR